MISGDKFRDTSGSIWTYLHIPNTLCSCMDLFYLTTDSRGARVKKIKLKNMPRDIKNLERMSGIKLEKI